MKNKEWLFILAAGLMIMGCADKSEEASDCKPGAEYWNGTQCMPSDDDNCGVAGNACVQGNVCDTAKGVCVCLDPSSGTSTVCGFTCCDGVCSDLNSSDRCGRCDKQCDPGWACYMGLCTASCPGADEEMCQTADGGNTCANLDYDRRHCGACGHACPGTDASRHIAAGQCQEGECRIVCEKGYVDLDGNIENGCEQEASFECGNGVVEIGEACDGTRLNDQTCASQVGFGSTGQLQCLPDCLGFDTEDCTPATTCGNGLIDGVEVCDGSNIGTETCESVVGAGSTGRLMCATNCGAFDTSLCTAATTCNNNKLDSGEICDPSVGLTVTCENIVGMGSSGTLRCNDKCNGYDVSGCTAKAVCGNGIVEPGEACDGTGFNGKTCADVVGAGSVGELQCDAFCQIVASSCSAASLCHNGVIDDKEVCDGSQLDMNTCESVVGAGSTGNLSCLDNCSGFDISQCTAASTCGNGIIERNEACDGTRLNDQTCATVVGAGSTGILRCNATCDGFVTTGCTASTTCGNGIVESGEVCDGVNIQGATCASKVGAGSTGQVLCGDNCRYFNLAGCSAASTCGNGKMDVGEVCEVGDLQGKTCADVVGFGSKGTLKCGPTCYSFDTSKCSAAESCGNGQIDTQEMCDGSNLAGRTCADVVGFGSKGVLRCNSTCTGFDTASCGPEVKCGNGKLDEGEVCDGQFLNAATCSSRVGFGSTGTLKCNSNCSGYDTSGCSPVVKCGNGVLDDGEACDGSLLNGKSCVDVVGFGSTGMPGCNSQCTALTKGTCTPAVTCGNGRLDAGEMCDMNILNGATCASVRGSGSTGTLRCNNTCDGFDLTYCSAPVTCGNGVLDDGEECDGTKYAKASGCNKHNPSVWQSGELSCNSDCTVNTNACKAYCGNGSVNGTIGGVTIGEKCDHSDVNGDKFPTSQNTCEKVVGPGSTGTLTCSADCSTIIVNQCTASAYCGDGMVNAASEACDGSAFAGGSDDCASYSSSYKPGNKLRCLSNCQVDTSVCEKKEYCGDGIVNGSEYCDRDSFMLDETRCSEWDPKYSSGSVKCHQGTCKLDFSACVLKPSAKCGNGIVEISNNEYCDGTQFMEGAGSCAEYAPSMYAGGSLSCTHDCQIDDSACTTISLCGNNQIDPGEECDGSKYNGSFRSCNGYDSMLYTSGGTLACTSDCKIDVSGCNRYCGDGSVNTSKGEECDHSASGDKFLSSSNTCAKVVGAGSTGTLACTDQCKFDTSGCSPAVTEYCGDGIVNGAEDCDGTAFFGDYTKCTDWNDAAYSGGNVSCDKNCRLVFSACTALAEPFCGDGIVNKGDEMCDGSALADGLSFSCTEYSPTYASGTMTCNSSCEFDESRCVTKADANCGNGRLDNDEYCDGSAFIDGDNQCSDWIGEGATGTLKCTSGCQIDTSSCHAARCGDGVVNNDEACDGSAYLLDITTCKDYSNIYESGSLGCKSDCTVDTVNCKTKCGNGRVEEANNEMCDGTQFLSGFGTCNDWITGSVGNLKCTRTCEVDYSDCHAAPTAYCGDGVVNTSAEECDGTAFLLDNDDCAEYSNSYKSGKLTCNKNCTVNTNACVKHDVVACGDGKYDDSEICDAGQFMFGIRTCDEYSDTYSGGLLKCTSGCDIDTSACIAADLNTCGNGVLDRDEFCDGTLVLDNETSCRYWGDYASGSVSCTATCELSFANCVNKPNARCGDGIVNNSEDCDKTAFLLDITACSEWDTAYTSGTVGCTSDCKIDYSSCRGSSANVCGDGTLGTNEYCDGNQFMFGITTCDEYDPKAYSGGSLKCANCDIDTSECIRKESTCPTTDIRCVNGALQMCDKDTGIWEEYENCTALGQVCTPDGCEDPAKPLTVTWCVFKYLDPSTHVGYARILVPAGEEYLGSMICTDDLSKPFGSWTEVLADVNPLCSDCYANTEFMSERYQGVTGVNHCAFLFTDGTNDFICETGYEGEHPPLIVNDSSIIDASYTYNFTRTGRCTDGAARCNGNIYEECEADEWIELNVCEGTTPVCDVTSATGCAAAASSFDHTVTMNNWFASDKTTYATTESSEVFADGSYVTVTGAFYVSNNTIDGVTTIQRGSAGTSIVISGLDNGVGLVSFDYKSWGGSEKTTTISVTDGSTTKPVEVKKGTGKTTFSHTFNNASARSVTITLDASSNGRVLVDNIRWTSVMK